MYFDIAEDGSLVSIEILNASTFIDDATTVEFINYALLSDEEKQERHEALKEKLKKRDS